MVIEMFKPTAILPCSPDTKQTDRFRCLLGRTVLQRVGTHKLLASAPDKGARLRAANPSEPQTCVEPKKDAPCSQSALELRQFWSQHHGRGSNHHPEEPERPVSGRRAGVGFCLCVALPVTARRSGRTYYSEVDSFIVDSPKIAMQFKCIFFNRTISAGPLFPTNC